MKTSIAYRSGPLRGARLGAHICSWCWLGSQLLASHEALSRGARLSTPFEARPLFSLDSSGRALRGLVPLTHQQGQSKLNWAAFLKWTVLSRVDLSTSSEMNHIRYVMPSTPSHAPGAPPPVRSPLRASGPKA